MKHKTHETCRPFNQEWFGKMASEFDEHIANSIPMYSIFKSHLVCALAQNSDTFNSIVDLMGSTGSLGKSVLTRAFFPIDYTNIDGSPDMIKVSKSNLNRFETAQSVLGGLGNSWVDGGYHVPQVRLSDFKADVYIELLGFQFFTKNRSRWFKEIADNCKVFVCVEKCRTRHFEENEFLKDKHFKSLNFTQDQLKEKVDTVLSDMHKFMVQDSTLEKHLKDNFKHVTKVFRAGNFVGYVSGHNKNLCDILTQEFESNRKLMKNIFNASPKSIENFGKYATERFTSTSTQDWFQK